MGRQYAALITTLALLSACTGAADKGAGGEGGGPSDSGGADTGPIDPGPSPYALDDVLRLNHVQAKGTHNSYHLRSERIVDESHDYDHAPLDVQLEAQGVRQFELDLHLHETLGWQVFHLPGGIDEGTTCLQLRDCLGLMKAWSDQNPYHLPIVVWMEPKDEDLDWAIPELLNFIGREAEIEDAVLDVIPERRILRPDELRGGHPDLPTALAADGWPTLGALRGRFIFAMLDSGAHRDAYLEGHPALEGRLMFATAESVTAPYAAMLKINNAVGSGDFVAEALAAGMVVTSNVDSASASDEDNAAKRAGSLAAGAHFLSSDYPAPVPGREGHLEIPGGRPAGCNPVTAPAECAPEQVEDLAAARALREAEE